MLTEKVDKNFKFMVLTLLKASLAMEKDPFFQALTGKSGLSVEQLIGHIEDETSLGLEHLKIIEDAVLAELRRRVS